MISYIEKGRYLHAAISDAGYRLEEKDGVWVSSDDTAVQAIIDNFDPLPDAKKAAYKRLIDQFNVATQSLEDAYPEVEKRTFIKQELEARAYLADSSASTPTLAPIASARGLTVEALAGRVISHADEFTTSSAGLIGLRQAKEDTVDAETDWQAVSAINLLD